MILHLNQQMEVLRGIPPEYRIGHIDATGRLVSIPKKLCEYGPIMNYFLLVKDLRKIRADPWKSCLVGEFVTSQQSVKGISKFFLFLNGTYHEQFNDYLNFRYMVCDYSWALIHSILQQLNFETIFVYADAVDLYRFISLISPFRRGRRRIRQI